ncbi:EamA family transporter [Hydrotalea sp.]|uniref:DMT family transporter n=1 Tax=Hydrotalea sp. TaxID=2881279 RepID=UPI002638AA3E|nr:EamA family transporter [Hydrotalea sp.]
MRTKTKAYIAFTATSVLWGSTWVMSKAGVKGLPGLQLSAIRQLIAGAIIITYFLAKGEKLPTWRQLVMMTGIGFFTFFLSNGLSTWSVTYISSGLAALIAALYPLFVVLLEVFISKKNKPTAITFLGLALGFGGILLVFYEDASHHHAASYVKGIMLCLTATIGWSIGTILLSKNIINIKPQYSLGWQMITASVLIGLLSFATGQHIPLREIPMLSWLALIYLIVIGSIIAYIAFLYTMHHLTPSVAALYAYINPIVALLIGAAALNEKLTIFNIIGSVITLAGVYLVNKSVRKPTVAIADADGM